MKPNQTVEGDQVNSALPENPFKLVQELRMYLTKDPGKNLRAQQIAQELFEMTGEVVHGIDLSPYNGILPANTENVLVIRTKQKEGTDPMITVIRHVLNHTHRTLQTNKRQVVVVSTYHHMLSPGTNLFEPKDTGGISIQKIVEDNNQISYTICEVDPSRPPQSLYEKCDQTQLFI